MADVVITVLVLPVIEEALSRVASLLGRTIGQFRNSGNLKKELKELERKLKLIENTFKNVYQMQRNEAARGWLQRLQDAADDLRVLLDEGAYEVHRRKRWIPSQFKKEVRNFLFPSKSMLSKIKEINVSVAGIVEESNFIKQLADSQNREADNSFYNFKVLQRDDDVSEIERLLDELSKKHQLSGFSIVGMPGVGKTALARSICVRARKNALYNLVAWVPVPKDFREAMIYGHMLEYFGKNIGRKDNIDAILFFLVPELENKKVLLILDGVWNEDDARRLKKFISDLPKIFETTRISVVITTSNKEVASIMDTIPLHKHELQKLSDEDCWLIMENVLSSSSRTSIEDAQLLSIGNDIAKQCGGLPLVAAVFGEHLATGIGVGEWSAIRDNKAWRAPHREKILSQLKTSYDHLPTHLKKCFSFCSLFPKEKIVKISRDELVQCWMANGFLSKSNDSKSDIEDVGNRYLNDLLSNYLLEEVDMDECGNIKFCKMHNEVHNLALLSAKYETYIWPDNHAVEESVRHMRVEADENLQDVPEGVAQRLCSLFLDVDVLHMMPKSKGLQSLKLEAAAANELPSSLGRLKYYMKYLDISESGIKKLPKSVTKFYNLQTLRFTDCKSLEKLPSGIENLVSLRHIYFNDERHVPSSIGKLTSLQTLPLFVVGREKGWRIKELKSLNQLRGKLKICKLELVFQSEASEAKLEDKGKLNKLQFVWSKNRANSDKDMGVLEGLQPHSNLKSLTIENYRGGNCPSWMMNVTQLVKLKLIDCDECGDISCLELLPDLKVLNIKAMLNVQRIGRMSYHRSSSMASSSQGGGQSIKPFPALRKLKLSNMTQLEEWTGAEDMVMFPRLEELHIQHCPELKTWCTSSSKGGEKSILPFPDLKKLTLSEMTNLEGWKTAQGMVVFSCLEELYIGDCPELKTWCASNSQGRGYSITPFPALRKLTLSNMTKLEKWTEAQGMVVFHCLKELQIQDCPELNTWWEDGSASPKLSILGIQSCPNLQAVPIGLSNLTSLDINNCPKLKGYAQEDSHEWSSICHTRRIRINGQMVRSQRS